MTTKRELLQAEDAGWADLEAMLVGLSPDQMERPGLTKEGWSVKDLLGHLAAWMAEAGHILEQIRVGTYQRRETDVEAMNREFYEANRNVPVGLIRAELSSSRVRMRQEWNALPEVTPIAEEWFAESGPLHYGEHVDDLRRWVQELRSAP
jgi:hypothetical protein